MRIRKIKNKIKQQNIYDFNYYGGYDMYAYKFSDDVDIEKTSDKENVFEELKKVDGKYSFANGKDINGEEENFDEPKKDEFSEFDFMQSLDSEKEVKENLTFNSKENSSMYDEVLKAIEEDKNEKFKQFESEQQYEISKLESERSILEAQKEGALACFDISYATKLTEEINSINTDITKRQEEVLRKNSELEKQARSLKEQKAEEMRKQNAELVSNLDDEDVSRIKGQEKYDIVKKYLNGLTKQQALSELEDPIYEKELGNFFATIYAETYSREK